MPYARAAAVWIALGALALTGEALAAGLPTRVCPVKGGYVLLQGGVMRDAEAPMLPFGKAKYPTRYFINVANHRSEPIWFEADWGLPGKKEKTFRSQKVPGEQGYMFWKKAFGVIEGTSIEVHLRFYEDPGFKQLIGETRRHLVFLEHDVATFKEIFWKSGGDVPFISGWPDDEDAANKVAGTSTDAQLQADILARLASLEGGERPACRMEPLRAEGYAPEASAALAQLEGEPKVIAEHRVKEGKASWERWTVRSCQAELAYEVLLMLSPEGGTDWAVAPIR